MAADEDIPGEVLAELVRSANETAIPKLLRSIERLAPDSDSSERRLTPALHDFVDLLPLPSGDGAGEPVRKLLSGLRSFLGRRPFFDPGSCEISKKFGWLLAPAMHAVERLVAARNVLAFDEHAMALLRTAPTARHWRTRGIDDRKDKLPELVPGWPELNDALFWYSDKATRSQRQAKLMDLSNVLPLELVDHYWEFGLESFPRVLDWAMTCELEVDQQLALSLAFRIYVQAEKPSEWLEGLHDSVRGNPGLTARLEKLLNPVVSEESLKPEREWEEYKRRLERERLAIAEQRAVWIAGLMADPNIVRNPPGLPPGKISQDQYALLKEIEDDDERTGRSQGSTWRTLIDEFGEDVASAYRDAAMAHWRRFTAELRSEGGNTRSLPYSLLFAMAGLSIEAAEVEEFPRHLCACEVTLALRYIVYELNGFPRWLEPLYEAYPKEALDAVLTELFWELANTKSDEPMHYILHDLVFYAPWLHSALAEPLLSWVRCHQLPSDDALRYSLRILRGGDLDPSELAMVAKEKATNHSSEHCASCRVRGWRAYIRVRWRFRRFRSGPQSGSHRHVSSPCSPNPACRFPAPGSPVGSCASHTDRQGDLGMQVVCGRGTASALHSHPVSGAPSSLFTPRQHRTRTVRLLDLCM